MDEKRFSIPLAKRVKQGVFSAESLKLETTSGEVVEVTWGEIALVVLGKVTQAGPPPGPSRKPKEIEVGKVIGGLVAGPFGTAAYELLKGKKKGQILSKPESSMILDLYRSGNPQPIRFEAGGTNFKTLLNEEAGYSGELNLLAFVRKVAPYLKTALDSSVSQFLEQGKSAISVYSSRENFDFDSAKKIRRKSQ